MPTNKTAIKAEWSAWERELPVCSPQKAFELGVGLGTFFWIRFIYFFPMWLLAMKRNGLIVSRADTTAVSALQCHFSKYLPALNRAPVGGKVQMNKHTNALKEPIQNVSPPSCVNALHRLLDGSPPTASLRLASGIARWSFKAASRYLPLPLCFPGGRTCRSAAQQILLKTNVLRQEHDKKKGPE